MQRSARINFILVTVFLLILGKLPLLPSLAEGAPEPKVTICHFPPGNPSNVHQITVGASAVPAHVTNHHDAVCAAGASDCCFESGSSPSVCTSFASDVNNCGSCGSACIRGQLCSSGSCVCPTGTALCGSACVNEQTDNNNCGACGHVCSTGTACVTGSCQCTTPGTTLCGTACVNESTDNNNCGACGHACTAGNQCTGGTCTPICGPGETLCGSACVNEQTDTSNCGTCGHVCTATQTCTAGTCTEKTVASSCLPSSSLSVLIQTPNVTAYVPRGSWLSGSTGVNVVKVEPAGGFLGTVGTTGLVNSCSSCSSAACGGGVTVCTGNSNDVYVISPPTGPVTNATAGGLGTQFFSGGSCTTCGVAFDAATGIAWIAEAAGAGAGGKLEPFTPPSTFGPAIGLFGTNTSEDISIDPVRKRILSAAENGQFQIIDTSTPSGAVYNAPVPFVTGGDLDATAEDCSTGVAVASIEFTQKLLLANLSAPTLTPGTPGTWTAPTFIQDFAPDFANLIFGTNGLAVAPGSHLAVVAGEFGGAGFGVVRLPSAIGPTDTPIAPDWVSANVPNDPEALPWSMGTDPHTVTAYTSPNDGKAYALMTNVNRTYLVKIDMALLLSAPRIAGTHTANPLTIPAGTFTFIPQF